MNDNGWNKVDFFEDKTIVKIELGAVHTIFLEDNGTVWSCGYNSVDMELGWNLDGNQLTLILV